MHTRKDVTLGSRRASGQRADLESCHGPTVRTPTQFLAAIGRDRRLIPKTEPSTPDPGSDRGPRITEGERRERAASGANGTPPETDPMTNELHRANRFEH
jgi:hypothetical protein